VTAPDPSAGPMARSSHDASPQAPPVRRREAALDQPSHSSAADNMSTTDVTRLPGKLATGGITVIGRRLLIRPTAMLACKQRDRARDANQILPAARPLHRPALTPCR
jgi:hypothetical protein